MNKTIFFFCLIILFSLPATLSAQAPSDKWKLSLYFSPDVLFKVAPVHAGPYTGYDPESVPFNFTAGFAGQLLIFQNVILGSGLGYSTKSFTGMFFCHTCDMIGFSEPEIIRHHFVEIPFFGRYNIVEGNIDLQVHTGFTPGIVVNNNKLFYDERYQPVKWTVSAEAGVGTEIDLGKNFSLSLIGMYRRSFFTLKTHSLGLQTGILYSL